MVRTVKCTKVKGSKISKLIPVYIAQNSSHPVNNNALIRNTIYSIKSTEMCEGEIEKYYARCDMFLYETF